MGLSDVENVDRYRPSSSRRMAPAPRAIRRRATSAPMARASAGGPSSVSWIISEASGRPTRPRERQAIAGQRGVPGHRRPTADAEPGQEGALRGDRHLGGGVRERPTELRDARVVGAGLERQRPLADRGQHARRIDALGDALRKPEAIETGRRPARPRRPPPRRSCAAACRRCRAGCRSSDRRAPRAAGRRAAGWRSRRGCRRGARRGRRRSG